MKTTVVKDLYPTGTCFQDIQHIWNLVLEPLIAKGEDMHETVRIVHGIIPKGGSKDNKAYSHAWVERKGNVHECRRINSWDGEICVIAIKRREYYRTHKIKEFTAYTLREFALLQIRHGHCGPFENRYHALTKDPENREPPEGIRA